MGRQMAKMPVVPVFAGVRFQPIDANEVAVRLVELALVRRPAGTRDGRAACVPNGRPRPLLPEGLPQVSADHAGSASW